MKHYEEILVFNGCTYIQIMKERVCEDKSCYKYDHCC